MAKERAFGGVSATVWQCVKTTSEEENGTVYDPPDSNDGTATTDTIAGTVVLGFDYNPEMDTVTYTIKKKPFIVSDNQIWNGISETIETCQR